MSTEFASLDQSDYRRSVADAACRESTEETHNSGDLNIGGEVPGYGGGNFDQSSESSRQAWEKSCRNTVENLSDQKLDTVAWKVVDNRTAADAFIACIKAIGGGAGGLIVKANPTLTPEVGAEFAVEVSWDPGRPARDLQLTEISVPDSVDCELSHSWLPRWLRGKSAKPGREDLLRTPIPPNGTEFMMCKRTGPGEVLFKVQAAEKGLPAGITSALYFPPEPFCKVSADAQAGFKISPGTTHVPLAQCANLPQGAYNVIVIGRGTGLQMPNSYGCGGCVTWTMKADVYLNQELLGPIDLSSPSYGSITRSFRATYLSKSATGPSILNLVLTDSTGTYAPCRYDCFSPPPGSGPSDVEIKDLIVRVLPR